MKMVKLKCDNCGGELEVDSEQDKIYCKYCGTKILIDDEASKIRRVEDAKLQARKQNHEQTIKEKKELDELNEAEKFKKGKLSKAVIIFTIICLLFVFTAFNDGKILSGFIGIIQIACFSVGWLMGMKIIKEKFKGLHIILIIIGFALVIPFVSAPDSYSSSSSNECDKIDWSDINLNDHIVEYDDAIGYVSINSDSSFVVNLCKVNKEKYKEYVKKAKEFGYNVDSREYGDTFHASSNDGYNISVTWDKDDKELYISLHKKEEVEEVEEIEENNDSEITKEETQKEEKNSIKNKEQVKEDNSTTNTEGLRSDFKKAMDSYEEYMDEYIEFMNEYNNNSSDYKLIMEYAKVMKKYAEVTDSFEKWKEKDLNDAETTYYIEVQTRVNGKLTAASLE